MRDNTYEYISISGVGGGVHGLPYIYLFVIHKTEKLQQHDLYLNQILQHFDIKIVCLGRLINSYEKGVRGARFSFLKKLVQ